MGNVVVCDHNLDSISKKLHRSTGICSDIEERIDAAIEDLEERFDTQPAAVGALYSVSNVLSLLGDDLERTAGRVTELLAGAEEYRTTNVKAARSPQVAIPEEVEFLDFEDITTEDLLQEARRQEEIIARATLERAIIVEALTRRALSNAPGRGSEVPAAGSSGSKGTEPAPVSVAA